MLAEIKSLKPDFNVEILGVNMPDKAAFNQLITETSSLPWLQDTSMDDVWTKWGVTWRDVRILDARNRLTAVYNLTEHDLTYATNRTALEQLFLSAAHAVDVDGDGLPDDWEMRYFGNLSQKAKDDPDGDGADNLTEFAFGSDPAHGRSTPRIEWNASAQTTPRLLTLTIRECAGSMVNYVVEVSPDLVTWRANAPELVQVGAKKNLFDGTGTVAVTYRLMTTNSSLFVRVRAVLRSAG